MERRCGMGGWKFGAGMDGWMDGRNEGGREGVRGIGVEVWCGVSRGGWLRIGGDWGLGIGDVYLGCRM